MQRAANQFPSVLDPTVLDCRPISDVKVICTESREITFDDPECQLEASQEALSQFADMLKARSIQLSEYLTEYRSFKTKVKKSFEFQAFMAEHTALTDLRFNSEAALNAEH